MDDQPDLGEVLENALISEKRLLLLIVMLMLEDKRFEIIAPIFKHLSIPVVIRFDSMVKDFPILFLAVKIKRTILRSNFKLNRMDCFHNFNKHY